MEFTHFFAGRFGFSSLSVSLSLSPLPLSEVTVWLSV